MNLKNFPKRLDSKTSCLRITVPENLDLALEGLIRKVLREQPKMDDIYAFAADYFDMLLKIREKVGTKFIADQLCPFHNDEDAHEMIKLASVFAKPEILKTKTPEIERKKSTDTKRRRDSPKLAEQSNKTVRDVKRPVAIRKKPEQLAEKKKDQKLNEAKPERPKTLKLEPKTEDIGDDEEFIKSDSIKILVEKELMDAAKSRPKDQEKEKKDDTDAQQNEKPKEAAADEELNVVVGKDNIKTEIKRSEELVNKLKEENGGSLGSIKNKEEDIKETGENKEKEEAEVENQIEKIDKVSVEAITETEYPTKDPTGEEIKKDLEDDGKSKYEEVKTEIKNESPEIETENDHIKSVDSFAVKEESQRSLEKETEEEIRSDTKHIEINQEAPKETTEVQETTKDKLFGKEMEEVDGAGRDKRAEQAETLDTSKNEVTKQPSLAEELNLNPDELCTVVDVLSIKPFERYEANAEVKEIKVEEPKSKKEEGTDELKIKTEELPTDEEKEVVKILKSMKAAGELFELANKAEEVNITRPHDKVTDERSDTANPVEKLKIEIVPGNNKSDVKTTVKEEEVDKIDSEEIKPEPSGDQKSTEDNPKGDNETKQTSKITEDDPTREEKTEREESNAARVNEATGLENLLKPEEKSTEQLEDKEPEKEKAGKGIQIKAENKNIELVGSSEIEEKALQHIETEIKTEEPTQNHRKTEDNEGSLKLEEVSSVKTDQQPSEKPSNIKEQTVIAEITRQTDMEKESQGEELKAKEETAGDKRVEDKMEMANEENIYDKVKAKDYVAEAVKEPDTGKEADQAVEGLQKDSEKEKSLIVQEPIKPLDEPEEPETVKTNAAESTDLLETNKTPKQLTEEAELNLTIPGGEQCTVVDAQHIIKVEEIEKQHEENVHPEGVQIKTIQTHYYDTLQVPEQVTKEYRVHSVKNGNAADSLLNIATVAVSSDKEQVTETLNPPLDPPKQEDEELYKRDLEDSLMTPSSSYSLNLSELSVRTISEMFLNSEKRFSGLDREERRHITKTGEKCGDECHVEKREVEEIIHKTIVPPTVGAIPVAPREDAEINEEVSIEPVLKNEKQQEPLVDSNERADSSNESKSIDSETPIISVEVKTVIETQVLEDEREEKDGSGPIRGGEPDVQIRIEATIDVPEGVVVDVSEEKENQDEVQQLADGAPQGSETLPKDSQTSSGESELTTSSMATEIKRNDSTKRHFSSTRTLITTQSLDLDKRNPLLKTRSLSSFRQGVTDFEVWNAIEKELEEAATKIQSNFRGYKTRKKLQRGNAVHITTEESSCSTTPVEPEPESKEEHQQSTGEFHDSIVLTEHPR